MSLHIQYKSTIGIHSTTYFNFINSNGTLPETLCNMAPWLNVQEKWEIVNYDNTSLTTNVKYGDKIGIKNKHFGVYLSGHPHSINATTQTNLQGAEQWVLVKANDPTSTDEVKTTDELYLKLVYSSKYCVVNGDGIQSNVPLSANMSSTFRIILTN